MSSDAGLFSEKSRALPAILVGGLVAGILDITDAFVFYWFRSGVTPKQILQSVASGLLGQASFQGGWGSAALGLLCHFFIATSAAATYYIASRKLKFMVRYAVPCGLLFGGIWYVFMNYVVVPLSHVARRAPPQLNIALINAVAAIVFCVGLPIALVVRRYSRDA